MKRSTTSLCLFIQGTECIFFCVSEDGSVLKDKGKWKCVLSNKIVLLKRIWVGSLLEIKSVSTNCFWKVTFLCFSEDMLCAVKPGLLSIQDLTGWSTPLCSGALLRTSSRKGPKLTVPTFQIILRLSKYWSTSWPSSCLGRGEKVWVVLGGHSTFVL